MWLVDLCNKTLDGRPWRTYYMTMTNATRPSTTPHAANAKHTRRTAKRDEWSCPCCGIGNDGSYCDACTEAECGEQHVDSPVVCNAELKRLGYTLLGPCWTEFQFADRSVKTVKIDLWRRPDGDRSFGGILEVRS